jgi:hypothetical protein
MYSIRYYSRFHVTAVGLGTYYLRIRGQTCVFILMLVIRLWSKYTIFNNNRMRKKIIANLCTKNYVGFCSPLEHRPFNIHRSKKYFEKRTYWKQNFNNPYGFEIIERIWCELTTTHTPDKDSGILDWDAVSPTYYTAFEVRAIFIYVFEVYSYWNYLTAKVLYNKVFCNFRLEKKRRMKNQVEI